MTKEYVPNIFEKHDKNSEEAKWRKAVYLVKSSR